MVISQKNAKNIMKYPIPLAILGGRGTVGQKVIALLHQSLLSSYFSVEEITSSNVEENQEHNYGDCCIWRDSLCPLPDSMKKCPVKHYKNLQCLYVLSCLNNEEASVIEPYLVNKGHYVFSNASIFRMKEDVPLCVPEINGLSMKKMLHTFATNNNATKNSSPFSQENNSDDNHEASRGFLVKNPNCVAVPLSLGLYPLRHLQNPLLHVAATSLQSVSGAGYPGVSALDSLGNTIPFIAGEREKIIEETQKILDSSFYSEDLNNKETSPFLGDKISVFQSTTFSAQVHRVPVLYGHSVSIHVVFQNPVTLKDLYACFEKENLTHKAAPWTSQPLYNLEPLDQESFGPQNKVLYQDDMAVYIGQFTHGSSCCHVSFTLLTHNLVRGAAGAALNNLWYFLHY